MYKFFTRLKQEFSQSFKKILEAFLEVLKIFKEIILDKILKNCGEYLTKVLKQFWKFFKVIEKFEENMMFSFQQYTVTSDTELQAEILNLLSELIQLKVNYCKLDSEQVFMKFLLSQFQLIEEEQLL